MLLELNNLTVEFPSASGQVAAVREISLALDAGETLALVGESGSGKSVTALAIMGLLPPQAESRAQCALKDASLPAQARLSCRPYAAAAWR